MKGTYNRHLPTILKDRIKSLLFLLNPGKKPLREQLRASTDHLEKFTLCNRLLGVHQSRFEVVELMKFLNKEIQPRIICEIGTANSGTNLLFATSLPNLELVVGIDLYVKNQSKLKFYASPVKTYQINGDSKSSQTINSLREILAGRKIDFLFIDGDHSYKGVKGDFEAYRSLVSEGGAIAFHDIVPDYQTRYGRNTGMWVGEVPEFWSEIRSRYPDSFEIIEDEGQDGQGIGVLKF